MIDDITLIREKDLIVKEYMYCPLDTASALKITNGGGVLLRLLDHEARPVPRAIYLTSVSSEPIGEVNISINRKYEHYEIVPFNMPPRTYDHLNRNQAVDIEMSDKEHWLIRFVLNIEWKKYFTYHCWRCGGTVRFTEATEAECADCGVVEVPRATRI